MDTVGQKILDKIPLSVQRISKKYAIIPVLFLSAFLNIYKLWTQGFGNTYYAAAIKSMMSSFSNFFFVSLDSSGFISVDKSPLSLWVDTVFAKIFGFYGFVLLLPHALEGILAVLLTYLIVKKVIGTAPALIASLVIACAPVNIAVYRNNTPDALLLVFVLLTILCLVHFFETKRLKFLLLSAAMLGLGFNTKMLQAFLILPAILVALTIFLQGTWLQRIKPILLFLLVLGVVSFSWISIVDLTPAGQRPFVGSSGNNSAWSLALGYNGAERFEGESSVGGNQGFNVGDKSLFRLFQGEMGTQSGWFMLTAVGFVFFFFITKAKKIFGLFRGKEEGNSYLFTMVIASIYLITLFAFFSFASFFHSYYLNVFGPPLGILLGGIFYEIFNAKFKNKTFIILVCLLAISIPIQVYLITQAKYAMYLIPFICILGALFLIGSIFLKQIFFKTLSVVLLFFVLILTPFVWSLYTTISDNTATAIFIGGPSVGAGGFGGFGRAGNGGPPNGQMRFTGNGMGQTPTQGGIASIGMQGGPFGTQTINVQLVSYLRSHNTNEKYFVGVTEAGTAESFILNENIGNVMTLGGFSGRDKAITLSALKQEIAQGQIRYFYFNTTNGLQSGEQGIIPSNFFARGQGGFRNFGNGNVNNRFTPQRIMTQSSSSTKTITMRSSGGGMFNANQDITTYIQKSCTQVTGLTGLYDCKK